VVPAWFVFFVVFLITKPIGSFLVRVFQRAKTLLDPVLAPIEKTIYGLTGISADTEMKWTEYGTAKNGSMLVDDNGSTLIGQPFSSDRYFQGRPSAASNGYDPMSSGAFPSN